MSKADHLDTTRRRFLSTAAAGIAAGGTVLALASLPASAADDPVFALIETDRAAEAALNEVVRAAPIRSTPASTVLQDAALEAEQTALADLIEGIPTTIAGVIASMRYVETMTNDMFSQISHDKTGPLLWNLAEALEGLVTS
jgi:hypothetical protein